MVDKNKYEIILFWSEADQVFICEVPQLSGCVAHGKTKIDALKNADEAIELWIETATEFGDTIPVPKGRKLMYA